MKAAADENIAHRIRALPSESRTTLTSRYSHGHNPATVRSMAIADDYFLGRRNPPRPFPPEPLSRSAGLPRAGRSRTHRGVPPAVSMPTTIPSAGKPLATLYVEKAEIAQRRWTPGDKYGEAWAAGNAHERSSYEPATRKFEALPNHPRGGDSSVLGFGTFQPIDRPSWSMRPQGRPRDTRRSIPHPRLRNTAARP